ncbi:MAG: hypothetical protein MJH10_09375 [Epibacterium sp.]|nr:hypothetical protein [Epibacterium sp.]NQX73746.1 hypothetical protein [Epibacterium sp.]
MVFAALAPIIGGAIVGGGIMEGIGRNKQAKAMRRAREDFQRRDDAQRRLAAGLAEQANAESLNDAIQTEQQEGSARSDAQVLGAATQQAPTSSIGATSSNVVAQEQANARNQALNAARDRGQAMAQLRGFGGGLFNQGLLTNRLGQDVGLINNFRLADRDVVFPVELDQASRKGAALRFFGPLVSQLGQTAALNAISAMTGGVGGGAGGPLSNLPVGSRGFFETLNQGGGSGFNPATTRLPF